MILTITLNPAVDYVVFGEGFIVGSTNRGEDIPPDPGGKGNNAARIAHALGAEVDATGIVGGFTGSFIEKSLRTEGIRPEFYQTHYPTRITASFIDTGSLAQTKIVPFGPALEVGDIEGFRSHLGRLLESRRYSMVSMNGSIARGMDEWEYERLVGICFNAGVPVLLDTSGTALKKAVVPSMGAAAPFMIKPNIDEARSLCNADESVDVKRLSGLICPLVNTVPCIALTLGGEGAVLFTREWVMHGTVSEVKAINPVCAGDAFVGGFLAHWDRAPGDLEGCFRWALAAGSATASVRGLMWERSLFDDLLGRVFIQTLN